jgi:adenosine deaminase
VATWIRDRRIALEASPTSNVQTGAAPSIAAHPSTLLKDLGFAVTVNTDNRLVSGTTMTKEMTLLREQAGWSDADLALASVAAAEATFLPLPQREELVLRRPRRLGGPGRLSGRSCRRPGGGPGPRRPAPSATR